MNKMVQYTKNNTRIHMWWFNGQVTVLTIYDCHRFQLLASNNGFKVRILIQIQCLILKKYSGSIPPSSSLGLLFRWHSN